MTKELITKDMLIGDIVRKYPFAVDIMLDHGIECVGCHVATWETLEQSAKKDAVDLDHMLKKLNEMALNMAKKYGKEVRW